MSEQKVGNFNDDLSSLTNHSVSAGNSGLHGSGDLGLVCESRRAQPQHLELAPELALVASHAVHHARDVAELLLMKKCVRFQSLE